MNGKRDGNGTSYYEGTSTPEYVGQFVQDEKHGVGSLFSEENDMVYTGNFHYNNMT